MDSKRAARNGHTQASGEAEDALPPHSIEAEAGVLGCLLLESPETGQMLDQLSASDFYDERHREIFATIRGLRDRGELIQPFTLQQCLKRAGILESCGGAGYVSELPDKTPSSANFDAYLKELKECAAKRELLKLSVEFGKAARSGGDAKDAYGCLEAAFLAMAERRGLSNLPPIMDAFDMTANPVSRPPELVAGLLHKGSKLVLGGGSKSCKTWCLADFGFSVSHGVPWLELKTVQGNVLFLNFEIQPEFFAERLRLIAKAKGVKFKPGLFDVWNLRGKCADAATLFPKIKARIKSRGREYALIVLDPIYKLYGASDENSARDVAQLLNQVEDLAVSTGAAVAFGAHFSKGNQAAKEAIDRVSGSGVFARDPDSLVTLTPHKEPNAYTVETVLRNFSPLEPFAVRFEFPLMIRDGGLDPTELKKKPVGRKKEFNELQLLDLLRAKSLTTGQWAKKAKKEFGMSEATFHRHRAVLEQAEKVFKSKVDEKWALLSKPER